MSASSAPRKLILGTRGSELALVQARMVKSALEKTSGGDIEILVLRTSGDEASAGSASQQGARQNFPSSGRKGLFTAELERALLDRRIDFAVHSAKDLPSGMDDALRLAAVLPRAMVGDFLITKSPTQLESLPRAALVASGSIRRQRQIRWARADVQLRDLRGNLPTRLRKFAGSDWDAIILAGAGLTRLGFTPPEFSFENTSMFAAALPVSTFVPAGGQGIVAMQTRAGEEHLTSAIDDIGTHACLKSEREFLRLVEGDCGTPVGAYAQLSTDGVIRLQTQLFGDEEAPQMSSAQGRNPKQVAAEAFEKMKRGYEHE